MLDLNIGFLNISVWDILDIGIVAYLLFQLYKLLRGSIAFNIFVGLLSLYVSWFVVNQLNMDLLSSILDQFVKVGIIILIIIFQPEVRRFLLLLGNTTLRQRSNFLDRFLDRSGMTDSPEEQEAAREAIASAIMRMSRRRVGALLVFCQRYNLQGIASGGVEMEAQISQALLESIFNKESPLHDGAVLIDSLKIMKASVILPVSEKTTLPKSVGLRHRAAVGITERTNVVSLVVSEETGAISFAKEDQLERKLSEERLREILKEYV
jgi:diadenylate cyclase